MEIRQLNYFVVLAHELHFARAAEKLGITQPPLSRSIQKLEKELGVRLFSRANKWDIQLTEAGKALLGEAERLLPGFEEAGNLARAAAAGEFGRLTVGAISSMIGHRAFIDTLAQMQTRHPKAVIEIVDSTSGGLMEMLNEHTVDLALMRLAPHADTEGLKVEKLYSDRLLAVLPRRHRLAERETFPVSALRQEKFILVPGTVSAVFRNYILDLCRTRGGFEPVISHEISNSYTALRLTAAGAGITLVSAAYEGVFADRVCYKRFSDFPAALPMYAVMPGGGPTPLARNFLKLLKQELRGG